MEEPGSLSTTGVAAPGGPGEIHQTAPIRCRLLDGRQFTVNGQTTMEVLANLADQKLASRSARLVQLGPTAMLGSAAAATSPGIGIVRVEVEHRAVNANELSLKKGMTINVLDRCDSGLWEGEIIGDEKKKGKFPGSCVVPVTDIEKARSVAGTLVTTSEYLVMEPSPPNQNAPPMPSAVPITRASIDAASAGAHSRMSGIRNGRSSRPQVRFLGSNVRK